MQRLSSATGSAASYGARTSQPQDPSPSGPAGSTSGNDSHSSQESGQSDSDPPNLKKARWPTRSELLQYQAGQLKAASREPPSDFSDRPAWARSTGDPGATDGVGQVTGPSAGTSAPSAFLHVAKPMSDANARLLQVLNNDLALQDFADANGLGPITNGLCFKDWYDLHQRSGINLGPRLYVANGRLGNALQLSRSLTPLQQAVRDGDLSKTSPNWVEVPKNETQPGDTFVIPGRSELDPQHPWKMPIYVEGHIGVVDYKPEYGGWVAISTNVDGDPRWNIMSLEDMETMAPAPLHFFHSNGPVSSKP